MKVLNIEIGDVISLKELIGIYEVSGVIHDKNRVYVDMGRERSFDFNQIDNVYRKVDDSHRHINNQIDDNCAKCGLDLRHEIHANIWII